MQSGSIHCHVSNCSRIGRYGQTQTAIAKAAYNARQRLWCAREDREIDYAHLHDALYEEILYPADAPPWAQTREELWNKVDKTAKRRDSRLAKNIQCTITLGIPEDQWASMAKEYVAPYVAAGHIADVVIHHGGRRNPHVHIMLTVNTLKPNGFGRKIKNIDQRGFVQTARTGWANLTNKYLQANGLSLRVDARSYKARGIAQQPTKHRGPKRTERALVRQHAPNLPTQLPTEAHMSQDKKDKFRQVPEKHAYLVYQDEIPQDLDIPPPAEREGEVSIDRAIEPELYPEFDSRQWADYTEARDQALHERLTAEEITLREALKDAPLPIRQEVDEQILHHKIEQIMARTEAERLQFLQDSLNPEQLKLLEQYQETAKHQRYDLTRPEPGPDNEPFTRSQLEAAKQRMIDDYEQEPER